jgi:hypothetical protein
MAGEREQQALARIDAALARIEASASRPRPAAVSGNGSSDDGALRAQVTDALRDLDRLIGALET